MPGAGSGSPCAACKLLRRKCTRDCVFAPYFSPDDPQKFAWVHKIFGASNVSKMLQELPPEQKKDAASSMIYEAKARVRDPVFGSLGAIVSLQTQVVELRKQLASARAEVLWLRMQKGTLSSSSSMPGSGRSAQQHHQVSGSSTNHTGYDQLFFRPGLSNLSVGDPLWSS